MGDFAAICEEGEARAVDVRIDAVVRDMRLIDAKTLYRLLRRPFDASDKSKESLLPRAREIAKKCGDKPYRSPDFRATAEQEVMAYLRASSVSSERKRALVQAVRCTRASQMGHTVAYSLSDATAGTIVSLLFAAAVWGIVAVLGTAVCIWAADGYGMVWYSAVIPFYAAVVAMSMYWSNFRDRLLRKPLFAAIWQTAVVVGVTMIVFIVLRRILPLPD